MKVLDLILHPDRYYKALKKRLKMYCWRYAKSGTAVFCEVCGWRGTEFLKGVCPKCSSLARTRLIPYSLKYFELSGKDLNVLHVAPNTNEYMSVKKIIGTTALYDRLNIRNVPGINLVEDLTQMTLKDSIYDRVVIWHVFEHIVEDTKAISEVYRVLRPGGKLLVSVPIFPFNNQITFEDRSIEYKDYEKIHGHNDHCRSCGFDYYKRFEEKGFKTSTLKLSDISEKEKKYYGLSANHVVWCFTK